MDQAARIQADSVRLEVIPTSSLSQIQSCPCRRYVVVMTMVLVVSLPNLTAGSQVDCTLVLASVPSSHNVLLLLPLD